MRLRWRVLASASVAMLLLMGCEVHVPPMRVEIGYAARDGYLRFSFLRCGGSSETATGRYVGAALDLEVSNQGPFPADLKDSEQVAIVGEERVPAAGIVAFGGGPALEELAEEAVESFAGESEEERINPGQTLEVTMSFATDAPPSAIEVHAWEGSPGILLEGGNGERAGAASTTLCPPPAL